MHNGAEDVRLNKTLQINTSKSVIFLWEGNIFPQRVRLFQQSVQYIKQFTYAHILVSQQQCRSKVNLLGEGEGKGGGHQEPW